MGDIRVEFNEYLTAADNIRNLQLKQEQFQNANETHTNYKITRIRTIDGYDDIYKSNKWTQTRSEKTVIDIDGGDCWNYGTFSHSLLQAEIHRMIDLYRLSTIKDITVDMAISDILNRHVNIPRNQLALRMLRSQISKAISYRRYYQRKKQQALESGKSICEILNRKNPKQQSETYNLKKVSIERNQRHWFDIRTFRSNYS